MAEQKIVKIDARAAGYDGQAVRVMAVTMVDTGKILLAKLANWQEPTQKLDDTVVVTDTPSVFLHWSMAFDEREHIKEVLKTYLEVKRSGLLKIDDTLRMYDPSEVIQTSHMDERGQLLAFDTGITNGHVAVLLAIWAARRAYGGYVIVERAEGVPTGDLVGYRADGDFDPMMPFSVGG